MYMLSVQWKNLEGRSTSYRTLGEALYEIAACLEQANPIQSAKIWDGEKDYLKFDFDGLSVGRYGRFRLRKGMNGH